MAKVKPYRKKDLARLYQVSEKTLNAWLSKFEKEIGPYVGRMFTVAQVEKIFNHLGNPD